MIGVDCFLIAVVLWLGATVAEGSNCDCRCGANYVCDDFSKLRTDVDVNIDDRRKWSGHFNFVQNRHRSWEREAAWKQHLEVQLNQTTDLAHSFLASHRQMEDSVQKNIERLQNVQSDLLARARNVETSLETLRKEVNDLSNHQDSTFKLAVTDDLSQIKDELRRIQTICSPPCENGGQCVKNVCNCMPSFTGDKCQQAVCSPPCENGGECMKNNTCNCTTSFTGDRCLDAQCGVDFDNGGNNGGGNISGDLVWPWMAAVYKNRTSHTQYVCDGSVIYRNFVLTSAGCAYYHGGVGFSVKLGLSDLQDGTHLKEYQVKSVHFHPLFNRGEGQYDYNHDYDFALLEVEKPITFDPFVRPVCLPPRAEISDDQPFYKPHSTGKIVDLSAYLAANSSSPNASLVMLDLTIRPPEECKRKLKGLNWEQYFPPSNLSFCAESSSRTCPHWGSPLMQPRVEGNGTRTWTQVGIRSASSSCIHHFSPRLDHVMAWVEATVAASSKL